MKVLCSPITACALPQADGQLIKIRLPSVFKMILVGPPYHTPLTLQSPTGSGPGGAIGGAGGGGGGDGGIGGGGGARGWVDETNQNDPGPCRIVISCGSSRTLTMPTGNRLCFGHISMLVLAFDG